MKKTLTIFALAVITTALSTPLFANWDKNKSRMRELTEEDKSNIRAAVPKNASAKPKKRRKVLVFYRCEGFVHTSSSFGNFAIQQMGKKSAAFSVDLSDQYADLSSDNLKKYDLLIFNSTSKLKMDDKLRKSILGFIKNGKGIVGIHAATDNFSDWEEGIELMGGTFNSHPWHSRAKWAFKLDDPKHVLNKAFKGQGFFHQDEIYCYRKPVSRKKNRILVSMDMTKRNTKGRVPKIPKHFGVDKAEDVDNPVSWCRAYGKGRLFYTNFGHNEKTYWNVAMMKHLFDGIQYALGDLKAEDVPAAVKPEVALAVAPVKKNRKNKRKNK
ncbi:MAG: ThuA domain-containing protein [Lentisphaeraceae bacterium]|nr:ThuA domain-containing protein [Lentisphaeraceae bacterium]